MRGRFFGRVHGFKNLYVADASLLCTAPGVNPQGSVMAFARRNVMRFLGKGWRKGGFLAKGAKDAKRKMQGFFDRIYRMDGIVDLNRRRRLVRGGYFNFFRPVLGRRGSDPKRGLFDSFEWRKLYRLWPNRRPRDGHRRRASPDNW